MLRLVRVALGLIVVQKQKPFFKDKVWFEDFCRAYLEMLGWIVLTVNARDVEFVVRQVLGACTYKFGQGGLQYLKAPKIVSPFQIYKIQNALRQPF